jgi:hypothetical protein
MCPFAPLPLIVVNLHPLPFITADRLNNNISPLPFIVVMLPSFQTIAADVIDFQLGFAAFSKLQFFL